MLGGNFRCLRLARINNDELPAARLNVLKAFRHASRRHNTAITGQRVRAHNNHMISPVDIWHGDSKLMAKHEMRRKMMRQLIHRCR